MSKIKTVVSAALSVCLVLCLPTYATSFDWKKDLEEKLKGSYTMSEVGTDRLRITKPGTVLRIQVEGISADLSRDMSYSVSKIKDGQVKQDKGFVPFMQNKKTSRTFATNERVYLFNIDVKDNDILLFVITCETFAVNVEGSTQQMRYKGALNFQFPKDYLATADVAKIRSVIDATIAPETGTQAAAPKKIELGQTTEQVEEIMGKPEKIVSLGAKTIYMYQGMKITFVDGKLADVQ